MRYNEKYNLWVTKNGLAYRANSNILVLCKIGTNGNGHCTVHTKIGKQYLHRVVYETFIGDIPANMVIDHKNNNPYDNSVNNLQCITRKLNNQLKFNRDGYTINPRTTFGHAFKLKYNIKKSDDPNLYSKELRHWKKYGYLKGEMNAGK